MLEKKSQNNRRHQQELEKLLPDYLEGRLNRTKLNRAEQLLDELPGEKQLVERLKANAQMMRADSQTLIEATAPSAPARAQILKMLEVWEQQLKPAAAKESAWQNRRFQQKLFYRVAGWMAWPAFGILLLFVAAGALLVNRNNFEAISFSYTEGNKSLLAVWFLAAIGVWLGVFVFKNHWKQLLPFLFNRRNPSDPSRPIPGSILLQVALTVLAWLEVAGLVLTFWLEGLPLINFLTFYQIPKEAKVLIISLGLLGAFWVGTELYLRRTGYTQTPTEWLRNKFEILLRRRLSQALLVVTLGLVLVLVAPFVVNTLVSDINNPDSLPSNLTTALAAAPDDTFLPPDYSGEIGKVKYQVDTGAQIDPAVQNATTAPVYRQVITPWNIDDAKDFARQLNFDPASLKQDELADAYVFTTPQKSRLVLSRKVRGLWSYGLYANDVTSLPGAPMSAAASAPSHNQDAHLDQAAALKIAQDFLKKTASLGLDYQYLTDGFENPGFGPNAQSRPMQYSFGQIMDGRNVYGPKATISVAADGTVEWANSNLVALEKWGDYPLAGLDSTLQKLEANSLPRYRSALPPDSFSVSQSTGRIVGNVSRASSVDPAYGGGDKLVEVNQNAQTPNGSVLAPGPVYQVGQQIDISGDLDATIWRDPAGQRPDRLVVILQVKQGATRYNFYLYGRDILALARLDTYHLKVSGKITEVVPQEIPQGAVGLTPETLKGYRLEVSSFSKEPLEQQRIRFLGTTVVQNLNGQDYLVMVDENGSRYISEYPEPALDSQDYKDMVAEAKARQGYMQAVNPGQTEASLIQDTGQRVAGVPIVKKVGTSVYSGPGNSRSNAQPVPRPGVRPYPPGPSIPDGSTINLKRADLAYYGFGLSLSQHMTQPFRPTELLIQPVYNLEANWVIPEGKTGGTITLTVPAVKP